MTHLWNTWGSIWTITILAFPGEWPIMTSWFFDYYHKKMSRIDWWGSFCERVWGSPAIRNLPILRKIHASKCMPNLRFLHGSKFSLMISNHTFNESSLLWRHHRFVNWIQPIRVHFRTCEKLLKKQKKIFWRKWRKIKKRDKKWA